MIFEEKHYELNSENWQRINMRTVNDMLGAEMIHNLYGRYWPQISSIRFRHTVTNYKDGLVNSYAPIAEWRVLQERVGYKFLSLDEIFLREIENILNPKYSLTREISGIIDQADLSHVNNERLASLLIDIMDFPLGEIYRLNVVQIEYGLDYALHKALSPYEAETADRNLLLSKLITPDALTVARAEEVDFNKIIALAKRRGLTNSKDAQAKRLISAHYRRYAGSHCAYGELPPPIENYSEKFDRQLSAKEAITLRAAVKAIKTKQMEGRRLLDLIGDERVRRLAELMARIGVFRDQNKAELGQTVLRRLRLLEEISRRTGISREDLRLYLLSEMVELILKGKSIDSDKLKVRAEGVSFIRQDHMVPNYVKIQPPLAKARKELTGICASGGYVEGIARIIKTKKDIDMMHKGDIMVAIGTDFDLLEIMHLAGGIVTEEGGLLSHASVVSRELGKPCLINVKGATSAISNGDIIELHAQDGFLKLPG